MITGYPFRENMTIGSYLIPYLKINYNWVKTLKSKEI